MEVRYKYYEVKYNLGDGNWNCLMKHPFDLDEVIESIIRKGYAIGYEGWKRSEGGWAYNSISTIAIPYHAIISVKRIASPVID